MEFKDIYEHYKVSRCGVVIGRRGKPLTPSDNGRGYPVVKVKVEDKWTSRAVHRLVAEAWIPNPESLPEVNHIDCNRWNFNVDNLEWCTHGYNIAYSFSTLGRSATGECNARCKTTEKEVREICTLLQHCIPPASIRDMGYDYHLVRAIKSHKNWRHVSENFIW